MAVGTAHGAGSASFPLLRRNGHRVIALDLPGHGDDRTPMATVEPGSDVGRVCDALDTIADPVILVGHSSGGMVITAVANLRPTAVRALVYLAAFLLPPGVSPPVVMREDSESLLQSSLVVDEAHRTVAVRDEALKDLFYGDCSDEDVAWARARLVAEPLRVPVTTPRAPAPEPSALIAELCPRFYVETLRDRALGPVTQRKMYQALPCWKVYSLSTSHSPSCRRRANSPTACSTSTARLGAVAPTASSQQLFARVPCEGWRPKALPALARTPHSGTSCMSWRASSSPTVRYAIWSRLQPA